MARAIKPCPYCGGEAKVRRVGRWRLRFSVFCSRCGARNGTGTAPTLTPPNEPLTLEDAKKERYIWFTPLNDWAKVTSFGVLFFGSEELMSWETLCEEWGYRFKAYRRPPEGEDNEKTNT